MRKPRKSALSGIEGQGQSDFAKVKRIIGVDGEGQDVCKRHAAGDPTCKCTDKGHIYTYLAAVDEYGKLVSEAWNANGLSHEECMAMLRRIPEAPLKFGFMFSYDGTKILEQLDPSDIYYLVRPKHRERRICRRCDTKFSKFRECPQCGSLEIIKETAPLEFNGRKYDFFNGSLTVHFQKDVNPKTGKRPKNEWKQVKIWDCFRFYGCAFVMALKDWKVGTQEELDQIKLMKDKRGSFDVEDPEDVKNYCRRECHRLAQMMRKLIIAHEDAGIHLERFDGAGSTASALLRKYDVVKYKGPRHVDLPVNLANSIAACFFGGRFEDSMVGLIEKPVHGYDIASAYPFAQTFLPCLECGRWEYTDTLTKQDLIDACFSPHKTAKKVVLGNFRVGYLTEAERKDMAWCPLPFRSQEGSIIYGTNFEGWAWAQELLAAIEGWPDLVELIGPGWVYETACKHAPFGYLPEMYGLRLKWGKEGPGIVMKLAINAGYGKTAQSIGDDPPFQSWVWAGLTTATTRGQLLSAICTAKDRWNVYTVATDGIYAGEPLPLRDAPRVTGTEHYLKKGKDGVGVPCPLGSWEHKELPEGVFVAKPGLYYRLQAELDDVRARGIGRKELFNNRQRLQDGFLAWDRVNPKHAVKVDSRRFYGAKTSIGGYSSCGACKVKWPGVPRHCEKCGAMATAFETSYMRTPSGERAYGVWRKRLVDISFDPHPKREREGIELGGRSARLTVRDLGGQISSPYDVATSRPTPEAAALKVGKEIMLEQHDWVEDYVG